MMPRTMPSRAQIAAELRSHIAERLAHGHALDDVLRQLGDPATLADSYLSAEPLVSAPLGVARDRQDRRLPSLVLVGDVSDHLVPLARSRLQTIDRFAMIFIGGGRQQRSSSASTRWSSEYRRGQTLGKASPRPPRRKRNRGPHQPWARRSSGSCRCFCRFVGLMRCSRCSPNAVSALSRCCRRRGS